MPEEFPTDFREFGERQMPPHLVLYQRAVEVAKQKFLEAQTFADSVRPDQRADIGFLIDLKGTLQQVALPGLGVDAFRFDSIDFERFDEDDSPRTLDVFDAITIRAKFYQDGSPYVLDGDTLDPDAVRHAGSLNLYNIILTAEHPPVAVQYALMDFMDSEKWPSVNKHELSPEDSQSLIVALGSAEIDRDGVVSAADYYPKEPE